MTIPITIFVSGIPKAQPRARACARGGFARMYDPGTAKEWKAAIAKAFKDSGKIPEKPMAGPVSLECTFLMPLPKKHVNKDGKAKADAPYWHVYKPDNDNLVKAVMDVLTQLGVFVDDCQVCKSRIVKLYCTAPGVMIEISEAKV
jgi:Holliday junction resolvase RusA-like endonuclease